jgi:hypothetical protein
MVFLSRARQILVTPSEAKRLRGSEMLPPLSELRRSSTLQVGVMWCVLHARASGFGGY